MHVPGFTDQSALLKHELAYCLGQMGLASALPVLESVLESLDEDPMVRHEVSLYRQPLSHQFVDIVSHWFYRNTILLYLRYMMILTGIRDRWQKQWAQSHQIVLRLFLPSTSRIPTGASAKRARSLSPKFSGTTLRKDASMLHQENVQIKCMWFTSLMIPFPIH